MFVKINVLITYLAQCVKIKEISLYIKSNLEIAIFNNKKFLNKLSQTTNIQIKFIEHKKICKNESFELYSCVYKNLIMNLCIKSNKINKIFFKGIPLTKFHYSIIKNIFKKDAFQAILVAKNVYNLTVWNLKLWY